LLLGFSYVLQGLSKKILTKEEDESMEIRDLIIYFIFDYFF